MNRNTYRFDTNRARFSGHGEGYRPPIGMDSRAPFTPNLWFAAIVIAGLAIIVGAVS